MYSASKNDIKTFAQKIEILAKEVSSTIDNGGDVLAVANKLVSNSNTFVFVLGEVYAVDQLAKNTPTPQTNKISTVKNSNYHNVRDSLGRFKKA